MMMLRPFVFSFGEIGAGNMALASERLYVI